MDVAIGGALMAEGGGVDEAGGVGGVVGGGNGLEGMTSHQEQQPDLVLGVGGYR